MSDGSGLFGPIEARGLVPEAISDEAIVRAMLRVEGALARAGGEAGLIPELHAGAIEAACRGPAPDPSELGLAAVATGTPVVPLLDHLRAALPAEMAASVHRGATSQDILDTALMLTAAGAVRMILADLAHAAQRARALAATYASTPMAGRTLLQHARPTTFGATAATWADGLDAAFVGLQRVREERIAIQLGGAVGTLEGLGKDPDRIVTAVAERLGLAAPGAPWHAERSRIVDLAAALATATAVAGACALDLILLAQTEVGEITDATPGRGGSSAMPHKRNPVAPVLARAAAMRAPGLVADLTAAAGSGELQRAAGAWHAEWRPLRELLIAAESAVAWLRDALDHAVIDTERMQRNLELTGDLDDLPAAVAAATRIATRSHPTPPAEWAVPVHHVTHGPPDAPVVILGNSLGSTLSMWDAVAGRLCERFRVVRYDLRGHGRSPAPPGPYAIDDLGADLVRLVDDLGAERPHLVGTSIGGMAAMWAAAHAPDRVGRLVVIGSSVSLPPAGAWIDRARSVLASGTASVAEQVTPRWVAPTWAHAHPTEMEGFRAMFADADPAGYAGCCLAIAAMDLSDALPAITAPSLVVVGSEDPSTPPAHAETIADGIRDARLVRIPGAAHVPALDHPDEVATLIAEHLS